MICKLTRDLYTILYHKHVKNLVNHKKSGLIPQEIITTTENMRNYFCAKLTETHRLEHYFGLKINELNN